MDVDEAGGKDETRKVAPFSVRRSLDGARGAERRDASALDEQVADLAGRARSVDKRRVREQDRGRFLRHTRSRLRDDPFRIGSASRDSQDQRWQEVEAAPVLACAFRSFGHLALPLCFRDDQPVTINP